jgi:WD40 repeat protein
MVSFVNQVAHYAMPPVGNLALPLKPMPADGTRFASGSNDNTVRIWGILGE